MPTSSPPPTSPTSPATSTSRTSPVALPGGGRPNLQVRAAALRGALPAEPLGARGITRLIRNPTCQRLASITLASATPATVVQRVLGQTVREQQSPFALRHGNQFESRLLDNGAAALLNLYIQAGRLPRGQVQVVNIAQLVPGQSAAAAAERWRRTRDFLERKARGDPAAPNLILKARLLLPLAGGQQAIEPDVLVAADTDPFYRPGEIKAYPDRGSKTASADIAGAASQAAVELLALRAALRLVAGTLTRQQVVQLTAPQIDLIFQQPGSFAPTLRPLQVEREVEALRRVINGAQSIIDDATAALQATTAVQPPSGAVSTATPPAGGTAATLADAAGIAALRPNLRSDCRDFCALAAYCQQEAARTDDVRLLGEDAAQLVAPVTSLTRLDALRFGTGAPPTTPEEAAVAQVLANVTAERAALGLSSLQIP